MFGFIFRILYLIFSQNKTFSQFPPPQIYLTHETFNHGSWAITPLLAENVRKILTVETKWLIICEDQSGIDLKALIDNLNKEDFSAVSCGINKRKMSFITFSPFIFYPLNYNTIPTGCKL